MEKRILYEDAAIRKETKNSKKKRSTRKNKKRKVSV